MYLSYFKISLVFAFYEFVAIPKDLSLNNDFFLYSKLECGSFIVSRVFKFF